MRTNEAEIAELPGWDLVQSGLHELNSGRLGELGLLVLVAAPRLRNLGFDVPSFPLTETPEHLLYDRVEVSHGAGAHSYYNSLMRRMSSFASALEKTRGRT